MDRCCLSDSVINDNEIISKPRGSHSHTVVYRYKIGILQLARRSPQFLYKDNFIPRNVTMEKFRPRMDVTKALQTLNFSSSTKLADVSYQTLQEKFAARMEQVRFIRFL